MSINDFRDMMGESVTHIPFSSRDSYGKPTHGAGNVFDARVSRKRVKIRDANGEEIDADGVVWILGTPNVLVKDKIQLPDATTPSIVAVERPSDETGVHHTKVFFRG
jgi:hypothetical protein